MCSETGAGPERDEVDIEFLGNRSGEPYLIQTNVYKKGTGGREMRHMLWFDPTQDFHEYAFLWNNLQLVWVHFHSLSLFFLFFFSFFVQVICWYINTHYPTPFTHGFDCHHYDLCSFQKHHTMSLIDNRNWPDDHLGVTTSIKFEAVLKPPLTPFNLQVWFPF